MHVRCRDRDCYHAFAWRNTRHDTKATSELVHLHFPVPTTQVHRVFFYHQTTRHVLSAPLICCSLPEGTGHSRYFQGPKRAGLRSNKHLLIEAEPRKEKHCLLCQVFWQVFVTCYPHTYRFWWCLVALSVSSVRTGSAILSLANNTETNTNINT